MTQTNTTAPPLDRLRRALLKQRGALRARLASADGRALTTNHLDDGQRLAARLQGVRRLLRETEAALQRLDDGSYGFCEGCERPISSVRLEILPHARCCVTCQQNRDMWERALS